jgi:hypothetical protein
MSVLCKSGMERTSVWISLQSKRPSSRGFVRLEIS